MAGNTGTWMVTITTCANRCSSHGHRWPPPYTYTINTTQYFNNLLLPLLHPAMFRYPLVTSSTGGLRGRAQQAVSYTSPFLARVPIAQQPALPDSCDTRPRRGFIETGNLAPCYYYSTSYHCYFAYYYAVGAIMLPPASPPRDISWPTSEKRKIERSPSARWQSAIITL